MGAQKPGARARRGGPLNPAIAERLFVADRTAESHMTNIFSKLGLEETPDQHLRVLAVLTLLRA